MCLDFVFLVLISTFLVHSPSFILNPLFTFQIFMLLASFSLRQTMGFTDHFVVVLDQVPSLENPEVTDFLPLKPGIGQNIAIHAFPTAIIVFLVLISTFSVHSPSVILNHLFTFQRCHG